MQTLKHWHNELFRRTSRSRWTVLILHTISSFWTSLTHFVFSDFTPLHLYVVIIYKPTIRCHLEKHMGESGSSQVSFSWKIFLDMAASGLLIRNLEFCKAALWLGLLWCHSVTVSHRVWSDDYSTQGMSNSDSGWVVKPQTSTSEGCEFKLQLGNAKERISLYCLCMRQQRPASFLFFFSYLTTDFFKNTN